MQMSDSPDETDSPDESAAPRSPFDHAIHRRVGSLESSRRFWRWVIGLAAPAVFGALIMLMVRSADQAQASAEHAGEMKATLQGLRRTLDAVDLDIRELRARILKLTGADPQSGVGVVAVGGP